LLQYDVLYGEKYAYSQMNSYDPSKLQIGFRIQTLSQTSVFYDKVIVTGQNFTKYSKIMVNGEVLTTQFVSSTVLVASSEDVNPGSIVGVAIVSANNEVISVSNTLRLKP
jgi:hypothetical protein